MAEPIWNMLTLLTPVQRAYLVMTTIHTSLGLFESVIIWRAKYASTNTVLYYLTSALVAITQVMLEMHGKPTAPCFLPLFASLFAANCLFMLICLIHARDKHTTWVCVTFLILFSGILYAVHTGMLPVGHREHFIRVLLFASTLANNFVPFDSLLAIISVRHRECPPQWIPLVTGLMQSLFGGLHRHRLQDTLMAPADAMGVAVHLFGLVVELQSLLTRRKK